MLRLDVGDVDLLRGTVMVRSGKGAKDRVVPLGDEAAKWVKRYLKKVRPRWARPGIRSLWLGQARMPLGELWLRTKLNRLAKIARIGKRVTPHTFRRTCATHLLEGGASPWVVKEILGHADVGSISRYLKILPRDLKDAHAKTHPRP